MAGPSEGVPAPATPSCGGIQQLSQPAHKFKVGSPRLPRGPSHETQEHTHAHTHIRMHTCNLYTHAHTRTLAVHPCTHMHTRLHTPPYICTRTLPDRASRALGYNLGDGSPHTAPDLHMPGPKWLVRSHEAAAVPKPPRPQTHQAQALLPALHALLSSPVRPAIPPGPVQTLQTPGGSEVRASCAGLCTCPCHTSH